MSCPFFCASEEGSDDEAKRKAYLQGAAIEGGGPLDESHTMAELREVFVLKEGVWNGMPITNLGQIATDTAKAMPYLIEAQQTGVYRGNEDREWNTEPVPGFIHLRHFPEDIATEKLKSWASGVDMQLEPRLYNGEQVLVSNFSNVDRELAKLLDAGFPGRSVEILTNFKNPDTGEVYPAVVRSVAFLDAKKEPAVPQPMGYSVKLSLAECEGVQTVRCDVPNINNQHKEHIMADNTQETVKLSKEDIQRFAAMETRLASLESENTVLKGAVNDLKSENEGLGQKVQKFQADAKEAEIKAYCLKLEKDYRLTPAAIEAILPTLNTDNSVVKMSADAEPIPAKQAYMESIEGLLKLSQKDALFVPVSQGELPKGKQNTDVPMTVAARKQAAIAKFSQDANGQAIPYHKALLMASRDPETAELFNPINQEALATGQEGK